jgi:hypothetical protein
LRHVAIVGSGLLRKPEPVGRDQEGGACRRRSEIGRKLARCREDLVDIAVIMLS